MANLKETRTRIASVSSTQQITKAMKLVSATKLRRAQTAITQMRPYASKLKVMLGNLSGSVEDASLAKYFEEHELKKVLIVVMTSDRGLCGAFNSNVVKRVKQVVTIKYKDIPRENITLLYCGKKGYDLLSKLGCNNDLSHRDMFQRLEAAEVFNFAQTLLERFTSREFDRIEIVYNQFKNAATQIVTEERLLPVDLEEFNSKSGPNADYIFEPSKVEILGDLIPRSLKTQVYKALLDSFASEHGARMVAMDKATENAGDLMKALRLAYNQARQAAITKELSEIVGGAAALNG
ncbi:MAG TPA: ATP synthase F1 subunit gamma [Bacteroidetes bacterium]|nr:ATP synthase F1 subunit gamma [Bacteroidota bacterium]